LEQLDPSPKRRTNPGTAIPADESRLLLVRLTTEDVKATEIRVTIGVPSNTETGRGLGIPVQVSEPAILRGALTDADRAAVWPGRVYVEGSDHILRHGNALADQPTFSEKPLLQFPDRPHAYALPFFYCDGHFELLVPPGETKLTLERGFEHTITHESITLAPGETREVALASGRFIDMKKQGWISGDTHIHWSKNWWNEDEDIAKLGMVQRAEDLRVANNLTLMHRVANQAFISPNQFPMGPIPGYCDADYHMQMAEEYRNQVVYGHLCFLNIRRIILPISTGPGMAGPDAPDYPLNKTAILDARAQGGISIEAHGYLWNYDTAVNVAHGLTDSLDQINPEHYYRFLDCGFRLPLTNGSDHPARVAGCARAYVKVDGDFTYEKWIEGIKRCRTFTTSGPLLFLSANDADIGDTVNVTPDTVLKIRAKALSRHPIGRLQIISNGKLLKEVETTELTAELEVEIPAAESRWIVARCSTGPVFSAIAAPDVAHTSAIYVDVNGKPVFKREAAEGLLDELKRHAAQVWDQGVFASDTQRAEAVGYVQDGVKLFEALIQRHAQ
jgi:hypothetical protein